MAKGKGMQWVRKVERARPVGAPAPGAAPEPQRLEAAPPFKRLLLTADGPITSPGPVAVAGPSLEDAALERDALIAPALDAAGANALPAGPRRWLYQRIAAHGLAPDPNDEGWNLGGLRPSGIGCCKAAGLARFTSIGEAAERLVDVARRAGATADEPAPDLLKIGDLDEHGQWHAYWKLGPYVDQRGRAARGWHLHPSATAEAYGAAVYSSAETPPAPLDIGWIPLLGPSAEAQKLFEGLRADWAGFKAAGVGQGKLTFLAPDVEGWNAFSRAWENSDAWWANLPGVAYQDPDLGPTEELGARLNAQVDTANRVRAEIVTATTGVPTAPGQIDASRKGLDDAPAISPFGKWAEHTVEPWVKSHPWLDWLTDPKQTPGDATKKATGVGTGFVLLGLVALAGVAYVLKPAAPQIYVSRGGR